MEEKKVPEFNGKYGEIFKLHRMLDEAGIPHDFVDETPDMGWIVSGTLDMGWIVSGIGFDYTKYHIYYPSCDDFRKGINSDTDTSGTVCSIIEGHGTYGEENDLLEIMGLLTPEEEEWDSVCGSLTAENVFERIKKAEEKKNEERS